MSTNNDNNNTPSANDLQGEEGKFDPSVLQSATESAGTPAITSAEVVTILTNLQRSMDKVSFPLIMTSSRYCHFELI
jgi:hypothetical protein